MIDGNTHALNEYHNQQDISESEWELSKEEKCHQIVEYAEKLMKHEVSSKELQWAFSSIIDEEGEYHYLDWAAFQDWQVGIQSETTSTICLLALEGASQILYDTELSEIAYFNNSDWTNIMLDELINRGSSI